MMEHMTDAGRLEKPSNRLADFIKLAKHDIDFANFIVAEDVNIDYGRAVSEADDRTSQNMQQIRPIMVTEDIEALLTDDARNFIAIQKPKTLPSKQKSIIRAIEFRIMLGLKIKTISLMTNLSPATVSRLAAAYNRDPYTFVDKINKVTQSKVTF